MTGPPRKADPSSHIGFLDEVEERPRKKAPRKDGADALDLDKIW